MAVAECLCLGGKELRFNLQERQEAWKDQLGCGRNFVLLILCTGK